MYGPDLISSCVLALVLTFVDDLTVLRSAWAISSILLLFVIANTALLAEFPGSSILLIALVSHAKRLRASEVSQ
jgi:hypothetical protein